MKLTKAQDKMVTEMHTYNKRGYGFYPYPQERPMIKRLVRLGVIVETIEDGYFVAEYKQPKPIESVAVTADSNSVPQMWLEMTAELPIGATVKNLYGRKTTIKAFFHADKNEDYALIHTRGNDIYFISYRHISKLVSVK